MFTLIYTKGALLDWRDWRDTRRLLAHRISNVPPQALDSFLAQLRPATPFVVLDGATHEVVREGVA